VCVHIVGELVTAVVILVHIQVSQEPSVSIFMVVLTLKMVSGTFHETMPNVRA
jgi:hypothetical protein